MSTVGILGVIVWTVSTLDLIASRAISWPLRTIDRNWSCSSCWVLVLAVAIVFASLLASTANFTKHCLACQAGVLDLFCGARRWRVSWCRRNSARARGWPASGRSWAARDWAARGWG